MCDCVSVSCVSGPRNNKRTMMGKCAKRFPRRAHFACSLVKSGARYSIVCRVSREVRIFLLVRAK